jgi:Domain of unknown function (DUF4262)
MGSVNFFTELYLRRAQTLQRAGWTIATALVSPLVARLGSEPESSAPAGAGYWLPVAYTVGLTERAHHPELVLVGLPTDPEVDERGQLEPPVPVMILRLLAEHIVRHGERRVAGDMLHLSELLADGDADEDAATRHAAASDTDPRPSVVLRALDVKNLAPWLPQAFLRYAPSCLQALQVVLPDDTGHFPSEEGCDPGWVAEQILLDKPVPAVLATSVSVPDIQSDRVDPAT